ncbi:PstS family phosphate ABC transporter substrate-binding protein [Selenihalanaerobacter shriftii]|uniref:Phosphate-binding protein n=1 Tax=Selenihalanaerobacter shriftii TaxID=142842 RepID=A0A1T4JKN9_9FIRM|nr:PstS family phosphate ABC transporter substrate-binding protein [Selenihalanaerobacter shriftii]SJZ30701.1 phosphate ABC transporter substrate-binding protein, PhoT family [Selenihalanaerobacter shriftii]
MKNLFSKKAIILLSMLVVTGVFLVGCGGAQNQEGQQQSYVQVKGSDTMVNMVQILAEDYMAKKEGASLSVTGGGSGTGVAALINDKVDIANASRVMKEEEIKQAEDNGVDVKRFVVAMDGLAVVVNADNSIKDLTVNEIGQIFKGEITNWKEVGGPDQKITTYGRQSNSGTFVYFRNNVLKGDYTANMKRMNGNAQIVEALKADKTGIGYVGIGYVVKEDKVVEGLNVLNIAKDANAKPASPLKAENVKTGAYPLARPLNQYTNGKPTGVVLDFIEFELSEEGQGIAIEQGFYPVSPKFQDLNEKHLSE